MASAGQRRTEKWLRAAGCTKNAEFARKLKDQVRATKPSLESLATYLGEGRVSWFEERPAYVDALVRVTGLARSVLFERETETLVLTEELPTRPFDALAEDPAPLLAASPLSWLDAGGVTIAEVPAGGGRSFWRFTAERRQRARVLDLPSLSDLLVEQLDGPTVVVVDELKSEESRPQLERLVRTKKRVVILARHVSTGDPIAGVVYREWSFVDGWREQLVRFVCNRLIVENRKRRAVLESALEVLQRSDATTLRTPGDVIELLTLLFGSPKKWSSLLLGDPEDDAVPVLEELARARSLSPKDARAAGAVLRDALSKRFASLAHPLFGGLIDEAWRSVGLESVEALVAARLLRRHAQRLEVFPEFLVRNEARRAAAALVARDGCWGQLCVDASRRAEIDAALSQLGSRELAQAIARALDVDAGSLEAIGRAEALFAEAGRRFMTDGAEPPAPRALLQRLFVRATSGWAKHYVSDGEVGPLTRPAYGRATPFERTAFVAECWAWSFGLESAPISHGPELIGHFPGWHAEPWATFPRWWSHLDPRCARDEDADEDIVDAALFRFAERIAANVDSAALVDGNAIPPIMLAALATKLVDGSRGAQRLVEYPWAARRAAQTGPAHVWRLAISRWYLAPACVEMGRLGAPWPDANAMRDIIEALPEESIFVADATSLPPQVRSHLLWRWARSDKLSHELSRSLDRLASEGRLVSREVDLLRQLGQERSGVLGAAAVSALWKAAPAEAERVLREALARGVEEQAIVDRWATAAPVERRSQVLEILCDAPLSETLTCWLRRSLNDSPSTAESAWKMLARSGAVAASA